MKIISKRKQKELKENFIQLLEYVGMSTDLMKQFLREIQNDRICGYWLNDNCAASVFKMSSQTGYTIGIVKDKSVIDELTVIFAGDELMINDFDYREKKYVRYDRDTRKLTIDGYGEFVRDIEKIKDDEINDFVAMMDEFIFGNKEQADKFPDASKDGKGHEIDSSERTVEEPVVMTREEYADIFLKTTNANYDRKVLLDNSTYLKIQNTLYSLGANVCVSSFVENIVRQHFNVFDGSFKEWADELKVEN